MNNIIESVKNGESTKATDLIEKALKAKLAKTIKEEKSSVMTDTFGKTGQE